MGVDSCFKSRNVYFNSLHWKSKLRTVKHARHALRIVSEPKLQNFDWGITKSCHFGKKHRPKLKTSAVSALGLAGTDT